MTQHNTKVDDNKKVDALQKLEAFERKITKKIPKGKTVRKITAKTTGSIKEEKKEKRERAGESGREREQGNNKYKPQKKKNTTENKTGNSKNTIVKPVTKKTKPKKKKSPRKLILSVCASKKSCGEHYGPYIWERMCNENDIPPSVEEFENNGITYKKSHVCQGRCKKASNIRVEEPAKKKTTQFSYMTPLKAVKLAKSLKSGAAPENIKKL